MNAKEIKDNLSKITETQDVFVRYGDDAYPATISFCEENGKIIPYIEIDMKKLDYHRNYNNELKTVI